MKKRVLALLILSGFGFSAYAQSPVLFKGYSAAHWPSKAVPEAGDFKLPHDDFVTTYGVNDTAAAIVHMYLRKHIFGLRTVQIVGGLTSGAGYAASAQADVAARNAGQQVDPTNRTYPGWITPVLVVGGSGVLWGLVHATVWSRRECYRVLYQYHTSHVLPRKVSHRLTSYLIKTQNREFGDY
ncbi:MAG: hypothetical protein H7330_10225 [Hymenobacteraceae bacterium]|nr:hypothetical protein [Hymenobacteraceae bacterium]